MSYPIEQEKSQATTSRRAFEIFAICDDDPERLAGPCRELPNGHRAALVGFDCADAIDAALKGVLDVLVVDWTRSSPERLTALSFLRQARPRTRIYLFGDEGGSTPHLELWR